ncbi:hypothetical protein [Alienimonas californiensis]|uniref:Uncharacterized protein n=1 Tax=Alienimonas californiensis TaxID=2527989 RepID=A0A517PB14_9PLAN|nr:hypothetical protein [Alienimonas californiensis]QDT16562.1 hypothetical protein CA12_26680 [Alienimonas californiensis]
MISPAKPLAAVLALAVSAAFVGCAPEEDEPLAMDDAPPALADDHAGHDHGAHPTEGLHGGGLIELGDEEYHGELIHDEAAGTVTIYILDAHVEAAVPIDAAEVTVMVVHDGNRESFKLAADPDAGDPEGKSSRFVSSDAELAEHLDHEGETAKLMVKIDGRSYSGDIAHDHDHDGEGHEGHDH